MNREVSDDLLGRFSGCVAPTPGRVLGGLPYAHSGIPYIVVSSTPKIGTQRLIMVEVNSRKGVLPGRDCCFWKQRRMERSKEEEGKKSGLSKMEGKMAKEAAQVRQPRGLYNREHDRCYENDATTHRVYFSCVIPRTQLLGLRQS